MILKYLLELEHISDKYKQLKQTQTCIFISINSELNTDKMCQSMYYSTPIC